MGQWSFGQAAFEELTGYRVVQRDSAGLLLEAPNGRPSVLVSPHEARQMILRTGSTSHSTNDAYDFLRRED